jgi:hypothetical protein
MALWGAQEEARDARTQSQIARLNEWIMARWESYASRQVPIVYFGLGNTPFVPTPQEKLQARLFLLRDLMRMELPDRKTDILMGRTAFPLRDANGNVRGYAQLRQEPQLWREYNRRIKPTWNEQFQGAECLYLIISVMRDENSTALDFFRDNEIGDVDGDGMPEILDGWGNPISFLRWAPGFESQAQIRNCIQAPDYFDPLHADPRWEPSLTVFSQKYPDYPIELKPQFIPQQANLEKAIFNLLPLIFSAGPDRSYGLITDTSGPPFHAYPLTTPLPVDPYAPVSPGVYIGQRDGTSDADDNITNHLIEVR